MSQLGRKLKLILSIGVLALLLLLAIFSADFLLRELYQALVLVAFLNVIRVISNHNIPIEK